MSDVSPEYHTSSPVLTTAAASLLSMHRDVRALVERVLAADGFDRAAAAAADRHAHAVAADQPPAFVGDRVGRLPHVELFVRGARERFQLLPQRLLFGQMPQPAGLQKVAGELAHLQQEPQVAALRGDARAGSLKDFHDALRALVVVHRREHEQEVGRVGGRLFVAVGRVARAGMRRDQRALGAAQHLVQQPAVLLLADFDSRSARFAAG